MKNKYQKRRPVAARLDGENKAVDSGAAGHSRPPLARMLRLHEWLVANRYPNCRRMGEEFEVSAKTVQRDVNFMRDQMRLPIEYDKRRFGFHYTGPVNGFPAVGIAMEETSGPLFEASGATGHWRKTRLGRRWPRRFRRVYPF